MSGDGLIERLRELLDQEQQRRMDDLLGQQHRDDEIERLRAALALAVGELSTHGPMKYTSPEQLMQHFLEEARRG